MKELTANEAFRIVRFALEMIKDAPLSREEMIEKAAEALAKVRYFIPDDTNPDSVSGVPV